MGLLWRVGSSLRCDRSFFIQEISGKLCRKWWWSKIFFKPPPIWLNCLRMVESLDVFLAIHGKSCVAFILGMISNFPTTNKQKTKQPTTNNQWNANSQQPTNQQPVRLGVKANPQKCAAPHVAPPWRPPARWTHRRVGSGVNLSGVKLEKVEGNRWPIQRGAKISCFFIWDV